MARGAARPRRRDIAPIGYEDGGVTPTPDVGGAALLTDETNGFAVDFTYATDASRVAVKTADVVVSSGLDAFFQNGGVSPKIVTDADGNLVWTPHNMYLQSATPATRTVTTVVGQNYTVSVVGSGSLTGSAGASGVATQASPLTFTATTTSSTFTLAGSLTQVQMNRGAVATTYLPTTAAARNGLAVDYDPVTHAAKGLLCEPVATNLLLNNATLSTQSVTVTAVAHTLSFWGTGTITLSGTSTAGPLVGTGASNRVSLTFTPTAGSLTCTVSGTVSRAQLETGTVATSSIPTFAATASRGADTYSFLLSTIPWSDATSTIYVDYAQYVVASIQYIYDVYKDTNNRYHYYTNVANPFMSNIVASTTEVSVDMGTVTAGVRTQVSIASAVNDFAGSMNGAAVLTDTLTPLTTGYLKMAIGSHGSGANGLNAHIRRFVCVPRRVADAALPAWKYTA